MKRILFSKGGCIGFIIGFFIVGTFLNALYNLNILIMLKILTGITWAIAFGLIIGIINKWRRK